jgi:hypothetical protein
MPLQTGYLVADNPLYAERGNVVRLKVFQLNKDRSLNSTAPTTLQLVLTNPLGTALAAVLLASLTAGTGASGTSETPAGSWYYDMDTSVSTWNVAGKWRGTWSSTGAVASTMFSFTVLSIDGSV